LGLLQHKSVHMSWWVAKQMLQTVAIFWPVNVFLAVLLGGAAIDVAGQRGVSLRVASCGFLPLVGPVAIILCGVVFNNPDGSYTLESTIASGVIVTVFIAQVVLSGLLLRWFPAIRFLTISGSVTALWLSAWAVLVSLMSVRGDWL